MFFLKVIISKIQLTYINVLSRIFAKSFHPPIVLPYPSLVEDERLYLWILQFLRSSWWLEFRTFFNVKTRKEPGVKKSCFTGYPVLIIF